MSYSDGPLPQWTPLGHGGPYEATDPHGTAWRLWYAAEPPPGDPHPAGYRLAPRDDLDRAEHIPADSVYQAADMAGMRIALSAVRADPDGARRQLGYEDG